MSDPIGSLAWTQLTGGQLTFAEKLALVRVILPPLTVGLARSWLRLGHPRALDIETIRVPDSALAKRALDTIEACASPALLQHSWRTYFWGAAFGALDGVRHDAELLLIGSLLHDLGATAHYHGGQDCHCFTLDSARAALQWSRDNALPEKRALALGDMITRHMNGHASPADGAEARLLQQGATCDVIGVRYRELDPRFTGRILETHPRLGFNREFLGFLEREATLRPRSRTALLMSTGLGLLIRTNPFGE